MLCVPRLQGHHHWLPAGCMAPMMCLLHGSCFAQGVGIIGCSRALCTRLPNHPLTSSSPSRLFAAASFSLNFSFIQCRTYTKVQAPCNVHQIIFPTSIHLLRLDSVWGSYACFTPAIRFVPRNFRTRSVERFFHNSSHRCPNLTILDALERRLDRAS